MRSEHHDEGGAPRDAEPAEGAAPFDVERTTLYTADELYDRTPYADSLDARVYAWSQSAGDHGPSGGRTRGTTRASALHDHAIDDALDVWLARHVGPDRATGVVGVMGGHAAERGTTSYADAARLGHGLGRTHVVATGGGPGAMEAANLGGRLAGAEAGALDEALRRVAAVPAFTPTIDDWVGAARHALAVAHEPRASLGVPTWFYGHEPPNLFATGIAKYLRNAVREAVLLAVCDSGTVFLPGAAGTVQEVFQDACENYYADESTVAPMVLVGRRHWTEQTPAWPLLRSLAAGTPMEPHVHLVDDVAAAVEVITVGSPAAGS